MGGAGIIVWKSIFFLQIMETILWGTYNWGGGSSWSSTFLMKSFAMAMRGEVWMVRGGEWKRKGKESREGGCWVGHRECPRSYLSIYVLTPYLLLTLRWLDLLSWLRHLERRHRSFHRINGVSWGLLYSTWSARVHS